MYPTNLTDSHYKVIDNILNDKIIIPYKSSRREIMRRLISFDSLYL
jgi:hypothetical protein